ncbi:hypothetical protein [Streptomyces albidus (ex Kaewkla and Franco 2022)]|uniref:hypothetical protein n=1 Tax=Streptomyces albidus (ex Kaewkla and Franco 2022) TaxID=722709 RepID=UPI0015EE7C97|nr:hypothetical protein [Streptomyces albidus (ex Kaewkla and Franco 2022)]
MVRNLFGVLLALIGAAAAAFSPFRAWYGGRLGRNFRVEDLFTGTGITNVQASLYNGLFLPMLVAGVLALIAVLLRSRFVVIVSGLIVLGFTALWLVRQGQDAGGLSFGGNGIAEGVGYAVGGGLLLLIAAVVMSGRRPRGTRRRGAHARVDRGDPYDDYEPSESPQPYGPFGTTNGPHGGYQADDDGFGPPPGDHGPARYEADATPAEEWDPWGRPPGAPQQPPQGPQQQPPGPPQGPSDTQRIPRRPDHRRDRPS